MAIWNDVPAAASLPATVSEAEARAQAISDTRIFTPQRIRQALHGAIEGVHFTPDGEGWNSAEDWPAVGFTSNTNAIANGPPSNTNEPGVWYRTGDANAGGIRVELLAGHHSRCWLRDMVGGAWQFWVCLNPITVSIDASPPTTANFHGALHINIDSETGAVDANWFNTNTWEPVTW